MKLDNADLLIAALPGRDLSVVLIMPIIRAEGAACQPGWGCVAVDARVDIVIDSKSNL